MHSFIAAISFCSIVILFLAAATVSAQQQPPVQSSPPTTKNNNNNAGLRRGGHHGRHGGHHRGGRHARGGHHLARNQNNNASQTPNPGVAKVDVVPSQNQPSPPANQIQNPNQTNQTPAQRNNIHRGHQYPNGGGHQTQTTSQNLNEKPGVAKAVAVPSQNPPSPSTNQNQNQNPNQTNLTPSQYNNIHRGKLFGYVPKNDTSYDSKTLLMDEFLHAHNWVRSKYNLPPFTWDEKLETFARSYLMQRYNDCYMIHSNSSEYGENLFWAHKLHWTPSDAVYYWYDEKNGYDFNTLKCSKDRICGHFTQMVWKDSERIGCALQHCKSDGMLMACEYDPPGNFDNENPLETHSQKG